MKKIIVISLILISSVSAYGDWLTMNKTGSQAIDYTYAKCFYKQNFGNFTASIVIKGSPFSCPYSIMYNPLNNSWK